MEFEVGQTIEISGEIDGEMVPIARYLISKPSLCNDAVLVPIKIETLANANVTFEMDTKFNIDIMRTLVREYDERRETQAPDSEPRTRPDQVHYEDELGPIIEPGDEEDQDPLIRPPA